MKIDLGENKREINKTDIPEVLLNCNYGYSLEDEDEKLIKLINDYHTSNNEDTFEKLIDRTIGNGDKIFLNTYESNHSYYIPDIIYDMCGDGGVDNIFQYNVCLMEEIEVQGARVTVYEKVNTDQLAYVVLSLDEGILILELI